MPFTFGQKLVAVRKGRGLSKAELAGLCKFARSTIDRYEKDKIDVSSAHVRILGAQLEVTAGYFITDDDQRDALPIEQLLAEESLKCFYQTQSPTITDRAHLERIAGHPGSPNTVDEWRRMVSLIRDGLVLLPPDENLTRTDRIVTPPQLAVVPKSTGSSDPRK